MQKMEHFEQHEKSPKESDCLSPVNFSPKWIIDITMFLWCKYPLMPFVKTKVEKTKTMKETKAWWEGVIETGAPVNILRGKFTLPRRKYTPKRGAHTV